MHIKISVEFFVKIIKFVLLLLFLQTVSYDTEDGITFFSISNLSLRYFSIVFLVITSVFNGGYHIKYKIKLKNAIPYIIWILFVLVVGLSSYINGYKGEFINLGLILFIYWILMQYINISRVFFSYVLVFNGIIICVKCVLDSGIKFVQYRGIYNNSNTLGIVLIASVLACYLLIMQSENIMEKILYLFACVIFTLFIFFSTSRTSMLACVIAFVIIQLSDFLQKVAYLDKKKIYRTILIGGSVFVLLMIYSESIVEYIYSIIFKWKGNSSTDITSGRSIMWKQVLEEASFWGDGKYIHCHNSFLLYLDQYGVLAFIIFIAFWILIVCKAIKICKHSKDKESIFSLSVIVSFIFALLFEELFSLFGRPLIILAFIEVGKILNKDIVES